MIKREQQENAFSNPMTSMKHFSSRLSRLEVQQRTRMIFRHKWSHRERPGLSYGWIPIDGEALYCVTLINATIWVSRSHRSDPDRHRIRAVTLKHKVRFRHIFHIQVIPERDWPKELGSKLQNTALIRKEQDIVTDWPASEVLTNVKHLTIQESPVQLFLPSP